MSHQTIDILFNVPGQSLWFDAPEGRPSAILASIVYEATAADDSQAEDAKSGSPAIEATPNTTFDAASGDGQAEPRQLNLTATTGAAIGRVYLATNALGESERVEVAAISSGAYVIAREPLQNAYAAADAFVTTRITQPLSSEWLADTGNLSGEIDPNPRYRWRLVYVVASTTHVHDLYFDVVRYAARHDVTPLDVDRRAPGWIDRLPTHYRDDQGRALIDEAYRAIKFDLYNLSTPDQSIRNREAVNELVLLRSIDMVHQDDRSARMYQDRLAQLIAWAKVSVSTDSTGASSPADARPLWRR